MPEPAILHIDMDAFYASAEVLDDPALAGKPVIVGGRPNTRGVVSAASYEAREFGVRSAMPLVRAGRLCPRGVYLPVRMDRYVELSEQIFEIFREYTPLVQGLSLDEAFLDVRGSTRLFGSGPEIGRTIKGRIASEVGLPCSVGVAPVKFIAKIASDFDKPDGLTVVRPSEVEAFLAPLPVRRLHGIGPATEKTLHTMGLTTVGDLRRVSVDLLLARFGHWGRTMHDRAWGIDDRSVHSRHVRKSLSTERTFAGNLNNVDEIDEILDAMASEVAQGLEKRRLAASTITVKVRYPDFQTPTRSHTLPVPTADAATIATLARELVRRTDAVHRSVRLLGIGASNLVPGELAQLTLFDDSAR